MVKFILWCILLVLCWPLALLALIAYPIVWLLLIPFRIVGIAVGGVLELVSAIIFLPCDWCGRSSRPRRRGFRAAPAPSARWFVSASPSGRGTVLFPQVSGVARIARIDLVRQ